MRTKCLEVPIGADIESLLEKSAEYLVTLDTGEGVLVLCDLFGATPSNLACRLADTGRAMVVSGLNLPMLLRVFNYPDETLLTLAEKAAEGGNRGIHIHQRCDRGTTPTHA
jgi:PTS system ascorbate-specific IIA component